MRYSDNATLRFALLHNALYLWRIVITSDSYCFRLFAGVIAYNSYRSELEVRVIASLSYRFEQHTQALSLLGK
jgi:hypothetical protein